MVKIDSHVHMWRYDPSDLPWITDDLAVLKRDYLPSDFEPLLASIGFDSVVVVQAQQDVHEADWLLELADDTDLIAGVVGWVDLCSPNVETQLQRLASHPKFKGVRHIVQDEADDFLLRPDFQRGIGLLKQYNLTYDVLIYPRHLPAAIHFIEQFPDQRFVLDHLAKPPIESGSLSPWKAQIETLASFPNLWCKLSGLAFEARNLPWNPERFYPYFDAALAAFGAERMMIGSNYPVERLAGEYHQIMSAMIDYVRRLDGESQADILGRTCQTFYNITGA